MNQEVEKTTQIANFDPDLAVKQFDPVASGLASMKERYLGLKVDGVEDKEGYETVKAALKDCVSTRTKIEPIKLGLTEKARVFVDAVNTEAKRIIAALKEIETPLAAEKARIDTLVAQAKQDKIDAELNEYNRRINLCLECGMVYTVQLHEGKNRDVYVIGAICVTPSQIKMSDSEKFDRFIIAVKKEAEAIILKRKEEEEAAKAEKARLKEEQDRIKKEQADLLVREQELAAREAKIVQVENHTSIPRSTMTVPGMKPREFTEPIRSPEEAAEENNYAHGIPDRARLENFATYLEVNMPPMVPNCTEEWAVPVAEKMKEQFAKMAAYIRNSYPQNHE